jgi:Fe-S oxidoreductase
MMDTRDRCEEVIARIEENQGQWKDDGKSLLYDYITTEELWACTTCNACAEECPVNINPVSIILQLRQYLILEESKAPDAWLAMFQNIENNGAPWALPAADRSKWTEEINP